MPLANRRRALRKEQQSLILKLAPDNGNKPLNVAVSLAAMRRGHIGLRTRAASAKRTASLSNQFRDILADAGLVEPRGHKATGKGRSRARRGKRDFVPQSAP